MECLCGVGFFSDTPLLLVCDDLRGECGVLRFFVPRKVGVMISDSILAQNIDARDKL